MRRQPPAIKRISTLAPSAATRTWRKPMICGAGLIPMSWRTLIGS